MRSGLFGPGPLPDSSPYTGDVRQPVILVENLVKRYGRTMAVDGIGFTVERGVTAALLGGNGAGKTTTLSILLGSPAAELRHGPRCSARTSCGTAIGCCRG